MKTFLIAFAAAALAACAPGSRKDADSADVIRALAAGRYKIVDLSHDYFEGMPALKLPAGQPQMPPFALHNISRYGQNGAAAYWNWFQAGEHMGTHVDAPNHWFSGKNFESIDRMPLERLICPAAVIDVKARASENADYTVAVEDLQRWEQAHGRLPKGAMVIMNSGWSAKFEDAKAFFGTGSDQAFHSPGFSPEAARWLLENREINGLAVDSISTDAMGVAGKTNPPFQVHIAMHGAGKYQIEMIANLDQLPVAGAYLVVAPMKVRGGSGGPARIFGITPAS